MNKKTNKKSKLKFVLWSLVLVATVLVFAVPMLTPKHIQGDEATPTIGDLTTYYSFSGSVEAKNRQPLFANKAMQIKDIKVLEGQIVKEDDVLMTTISGEKITAKIDGEISKIYAEENAQKMPGDKLMDIVDYSDLQISVKVDEYDLAAISKDKEATVTIHALSKDVKGTVAEVSKEGTYMNGVTFFTATIALENDNAVKVGMSAEARVLDKSVKKALLLPMSAISFDANNKPFVYVKSDKAAISTPIQTGLTDGINVEIVSGISKDTIIVTAKAEKAGFTPPFARARTQESDSSSGGN